MPKSFKFGTLNQKLNFVPLRNYGEICLVYVPRKLDAKHQVYALGLVKDEISKKFEEEEEKGEEVYVSAKDLIDAIKKGRQQAKMHNHDLDAVVGYLDSKQLDL